MTTYNELADKFIEGGIDPSSRNFITDALKNRYAENRKNPVFSNVKKLTKSELDFTEIQCTTLLWILFTYIGTEPINSIQKYMGHGLNQKAVIKIIDDFEKKNT